MARKVFISVLGTSNYQECKYVTASYKSQPVRFVQEATLDFLMKNGKWEEQDCGYILLTSQAYECNWKDNGQRDRIGNVILQEGLSTRLCNMHLPFGITEIKDLPIGNNETEIWNIFTKVYEILEEGDELYFDLTHGFRYLPMLVLVLSNYARYLKNITIKSITYGNYEGRNKETNEALIVNLLSLSAVQDWAFAAGQFLRNGNAETLCNLCDAGLKPILREAQGSNLGASALRDSMHKLRDIVMERQTCRGISIINAKALRNFKEKAFDAESEIIPPLHPIFQKITQSLDDFDTNENLTNAFMAAEWCCHNGLYQQAITLLQEYIVSALCEQNKMDRLDENSRNLINSVFKIAVSQLPEEEWKISDENDKITIHRLLQTNWFLNTEFVKLYADISNTRNDINHSGMRQNRQPLSATQIQKKAECYIEKCRDILLDNKSFNNLL